MTIDGQTGRVTPPGAPGSLHRRFNACPDAIRVVLAQAQAWMLACGLSAILRAEAELVLAEVLNNIAEHAYASDCGPVDLRLRRCGDGILCLISDRGSAMPGDDLPEGASPMASTSRIARDDLPEGGFGWHLIRLLARDLRYRRNRDRNRLAFVLDAGNWR